jgi:hypothetical protein
MVRGAKIVKIDIEQRNIGKTHTEIGNTVKNTEMKIRKNVVSRGERLPWPPCFEIRK